MVQIELAKVLVVLVDHDNEMISGKFYGYGSSLLHPCKVLVSRTSVIFAVLSCLYQDDQLREWYELTAAFPGGIILEAPVVQFPYDQNYAVVASTIYTATSFSKNCPSGLPFQILGLAF